MDFPRLNKNGLGRAVQHIAFQCLDLPGGNGGARGQVIDNNTPVLIGDILAVAVADGGPAAVSDKKCYAFQRGRSALDILLDHKGGAGCVGKVEDLRVIGPHVHRLRPGGLVDGVAGDGGRLRHHQRTNYAIDGDFSVLVGEIQAVAADLAVFIGDKLAGGGSDFEGDALQRLPSKGVPFVDHQRSRLGVGHNDGLRVAALPDGHIGAGLVHDIAGRGLDFRQHISAGGEVGDLDLSAAVGGEYTVGG